MVLSSAIHHRRRGRVAATVALEWDGTTYEYGENLGARAHPLSRELHCYAWREPVRGRLRSLIRSSRTSARTGPLPGTTTCRCPTTACGPSAIDCPTAPERDPFARRVPVPDVSEFAFEVALSARLESDRDAVITRQLGTACHGNRVMDLVVVDPGPGFAERTAITPERIPLPAIESAVGPGRARYWKDAFEIGPDRAEAVVERAVELGFFERERRNGRTYVRQTARYPEDWFERLVGIENKPDLGRPGDLQTQLRKDVSLGLLDAVILSTESHVTGAHLNRIPEAVGIWRFFPDTGEREVIREPTPLAPTEPGIDVLERRTARTDVAVVTAEEKRRQRRRVAERAYGKGWRTYDFPDCAEVEAAERFGRGGLPYCAWKGRIVDPARECGPDCAGYDPAGAPDVDAAAERADGQPWEPDPEGRQRRQSGLDRFT